MQFNRKGLTLNAIALTQVKPKPVVPHVTVISQIPDPAPPPTRRCAGSSVVCKSLRPEPVSRAFQIWLPLSGTMGAP